MKKYLLCIAAGAIAATSFAGTTHKQSVVPVAFDALPPATKIAAVLDLTDRPENQSIHKLLQLILHAKSAAPKAESTLGELMNMFGITKDERKEAGLDATFCFGLSAMKQGAHEKNPFKSAHMFGAVSADHGYALEKIINKKLMYGLGKVGPHGWKLGDFYMRFLPTMMLISNDRATLHQQTAAILSKRNEGPSQGLVESYEEAPKSSLLTICAAGSAPATLVLNDSKLDLNIPFGLFRNFLPKASTKMTSKFTEFVGLGNLSPYLMHNLPGGAVATASVHLNIGGLAKNSTQLLGALGPIAASIGRLESDVSIGLYPVGKLGSPSSYGLLLSFGATDYGDPAATLFGAIDLLKTKLGPVSQGFFLPAKVPGATRTLELGEVPSDVLGTAIEKSVPKLAKMFGGKQIPHFYCGSVGRSFILASNEELFTRAVTALSSHTHTLADDVQYKSAPQRLGLFRFMFSVKNAMNTLPASIFGASSASTDIEGIRMLLSDWPGPISIDLGKEFLRVVLPLDAPKLQMIAGAAG